MIRLYATIFAALAGLAFGSFLNVCLTRWPLGESILKPRSHCRACGRTLAWWENIPVVSWIALRGRCRTCGAWIGWRYPLVELAVGLMWPIAVWKSNPTLWLFPSERVAFGIWIIGKLVFLWMAIALAVLDSEQLWLPDRITIPGAAVGFIFNFLYVAAHSPTVLAYYGALAVRSRLLWRFAWHRIAGILLAALLILLIRWTYKLIRKREGIGLGDAKLMAMLAAWLGLPGALLSFFIGVTLGALTALALLALPKPRTKKAGLPEEHPSESPAGAQSWALRKLPLGTFLCIGGIVSALWGQSILAAYLHWAGF